jgi:SAM-dependent methyltransferase
MSPVSGYYNYDNSISLLLSTVPIYLLKFLFSFNIISKENYDSILFSKKNSIRRLDVRKRLPFNDSSVDFVYSSHMLEHLNYNDAVKFLTESLRILKTGAMIRLVLPDLDWIIKSYLEDNDADLFMERSLLFESYNGGWLNRLKLFLLGPRKHQWMYNSESLKKLLQRVGFNSVEVLVLGNSNYSNVGSLDLTEGGPYSIFIEATK